MTHNTKPEEGTCQTCGRINGLHFSCCPEFNFKLSPSSTAPQPLDSIVDEYYDVYCPSKGITGIYTDDFVAFLSEGFTIQKKQP